MCGAAVAATPNAPRPDVWAAEAALKDNDPMEELDFIRTLSEEIVGQAEAHNEPEQLRASMARQEGQLCRHERSDVGSSQQGCPANGRPRGR